MVALAFSSRSIVAQTFYTIRQLAEAVDSSAAPYVTRLGHTVNWYTWDTYVGQDFKKVKRISSYHHFISVLTTLVQCK